MPFARQGGVITGGLEHLGDRHHVGLEQSPARTGIQSRDQRRPRRRAFGVVVELLEPQPLGSEPIDVGRANLTAVTADVGKSHVVDHD